MLMTPREANLAIKGYNNKIKAQYYNTERAFFNAYGRFKVKNFKPEDPFESKDKQDNQRGYRKTSMKEREETLSYLFGK